MSTTTVQYVTTDYLGNENFLKAANIKAGTNITVSTSGNDVTISANSSGPELNYYHEDPSQNAADINPPECLNVDTKSIYMNGPTFYVNSASNQIAITQSDGIKLTSSNSIFLSGPTRIKANENNYLSVESGQIGLNTNVIYLHANSTFINGPLYVGTTFFAGPDGIVTINGVKPVLNVTSSDGSVTVTQSDYDLDLKASAGFNPIYYKEVSEQQRDQVRIKAPWIIDLDATHSIYASGPYVFMGNRDRSYGFSYDQSVGVNGSIFLKASSVFIQGPAIHFGESDNTDNETRLSFSPSTKLIFRSLYADGPTLEVKSDDVKFTGTKFIVGPSKFINLNQPERPGISISPTNIVISMTENAGTAQQVIGTTLTLDKNTAKIAAYSVGSGKEFTFNVHGVDVLDKVVNKHFENLTRVDGLGGEGAWNKMKNNGVYYFLHGSRIDSDLDFRNETTGPAGGELAIDVASDGGDIGTVRTAELHVKHSKLAAGIMWPTSWQWVDEADPTIPPTIPESADGKWVCFTIKTVVTPEDYTFTHIVLSYIYG